MKKCFLLVVIGLVAGIVMTSCQERLDFGVNWYSWADDVQMTKDSLKIELKWYGDTTSLVATVTDREDKVLAVISRQTGDDICTVVKYLRNDTGGIRGFLIYPNCYPMAKRRGDAKTKEGEPSDEVGKYKKMLWKEFSHCNHPCDIGLALVLDEREDRPYASRYYFKRENDCEGICIKEVYDPKTTQRIKVDEVLTYEVLTEERPLCRDSVTGDVQLMFTNIEEIEDGAFTYKTYMGYRPLEKMEYSGYHVSKHIVFRSDRPEPYVTLEYEPYPHRYTLTRDYDGMTFASTYHDGLLRKREKISRYGTTLYEEVYTESTDKQAYILTLKNYDYQVKRLEIVKEIRITEAEIRVKNHEEDEMDLSGYLHDMWGSYSINSFWDAERYCRQY